MTNIGIVIDWKFPQQEGMRTRNGKIIKFPGGIPSQADQDTWAVEYETYLADQQFDVSRLTKYESANAEYVERGIILTGAKARGSTPKQALNATAIKETQRGGPNAATLANLHDKLELLKDAIEAASDQAALDAIDVTDNSHWV